MLILEIFWGRGHTSEPAPCRLILSLEHGKQNLWWGTDGHWTKCVSSKRSWHNVHLSVAVLAAAAAAAAAADAFVSGTEGGTCGNVGAAASIGVPGATPSGPPPPGADAFKALPPLVPLAAGPPTPPGPLTLGPLTPGTPAPGAPPPLASLDVTVVELTWRLPDDLRPLDEPPTKRDLLKKKKDGKSTNLLQAIKNSVRRSQGK